MFVLQNPIVISLKFTVFDVVLLKFAQISVLPILSTEEHGLNDDEECAARQMIRHVSVALKKYMESHLFYKYTQMSRLNEPINPAQTINVSRVSVEPIAEFSNEFHCNFFVCFCRRQNYCRKQLANRRRHCRRCFRLERAGNRSIKYWN